MNLPLMTLLLLAMLCTVGACKPSHAPVGEPVTTAADDDSATDDDDSAGDDDSAD